MASYADATHALYQAPLAQFIDERKRLAGELKAGGDKAGATKLGKLAKPPVSAWAVNQLYWHARAAVDRLFEAADRLRTGDMKATAEHRESIQALRKRAESLLADAGHNANEATLRRIALTLSALSAAGTWEPDEPGQLSADRDPPGFDALSGFAEMAAARKEEEAEEPAPEETEEAPPPPPKKSAPHDELADRRRAAAEKEAAEKERAEQRKRDAKAKLKNELEQRLASAQKNVESAEHLVAKLSEELGNADDALTTARENVEEIQAQLDALD